MVFEYLDKFGSYMPYLRTFFIVTLAWFLFNRLIGFVRKALLSRARTKKQLSNVEIITRLLKYIFFISLALLAIFTFSGSWDSLGLTFGFLSAAIGFALQRPISGIAAWIIIILKRPFEIGDRVIIGKVKGDVADISLSHIHLKEIGGLIASEENSGRMILIPNAVLFEQNIINYSHKNENVLDQVSFVVTFDSNLDKSMKVALDAAVKHTKEFFHEVPREPYVRTFFNPSGISLNVRYFAPAQRLQEFSSRITKEIYDNLMKHKDIRLAYPHTEVILRK